VCEQVFVPLRHGNVFLVASQVLSKACPSRGAFLRRSFASLEARLPCFQPSWKAHETQLSKKGVYSVMHEALARKTQHATHYGARLGLLLPRTFRLFCAWKRQTSFANCFACRNPSTNASASKPTA
jgi:hypothetical protein